MNSSPTQLPTRRPAVTPAVERRTPDQHVARAAGALMIAGAVLVTIGFVVLGSRFNYPDVLEEPANDILLRFHADAFVIGALFVGLAAASALLIPIAWLSRHLMAENRSRTRRLMVMAGIAAGVVQFIGLMRWPLLIPNLADTVADPAASAATKAVAIDTFQTLHTYLGGVVGEALGYAFTATWTLAIILGIARKPGRWFAPLGLASAVLIATGLLEPLGIAAAGLANFVGYSAWIIWMIGFGTWLLRHPVAVGATEEKPLRSSSHDGGPR